MQGIATPLLSSQWATHIKFDMTPNVSRMVWFSISHWIFDAQQGVCWQRSHHVMNHSLDTNLHRSIKPTLFCLSVLRSPFSVLRSPFSTNNNFINDSSQASIFAYNRNRLLRITPMIWFGGLYQLPQSADYEELRSLWILLFVMAFDFFSIYTYS